MGQPSDLPPSVQDDIESEIANFPLRYVISDDAPNNEVYGPERRYGVWDREENKWATLPNAVLCWGLTHNGALDALIELRGGARAEELRDDR
jgi:hypothetical protein